MDPTCWEKATTIAREPSNEHDTYAVAAVENVEGGATGDTGCANQLCTVKALSPRPPFVAVDSTARGGWGHGGYTSAGAGTQQRHEELYASMQQGDEEFLHTGVQQ